MKNKNNITKIMLLTCLIVGGSVNAENFFTCVPEEDWFKKNFELNMLQEKLKVAKTQIDNDNAWELVAENQTSGNLPMGIYKVIVKGGDGGASGKSQNGGKGGDGGQGNLSLVYILKAEEGNLGSVGSFSSFNTGFVGEISKEVFMIKTTTPYVACFGRKGNDGGNGIGGKGGDGGAGGKPWGNDFEVGGEGGGGGGGGGATGGQGGGGAGGYFKINDKTVFANGGVGGKSLDVINGIGGTAGTTLESYSYEGEQTGGGSKGDGNNEYVYASDKINNGGYACEAGKNGSYGNKHNGFNGGKGGVGYWVHQGICTKRMRGKCWNFVYNCSHSRTSITDCARNGQKGFDGTAGAGGAGGQLMRSDEKSNPGDGYVRIYKYKG